MNAATRRGRRRIRRVLAILLMILPGLGLVLDPTETEVTVWEDGSFQITGCVARQMCDDR
jgi:hypothetical protein